MPRIVRREENIVNVDEDPGAQTRQDLQVFADHVTAYSNDVTGINKQNITAFQSIVFAYSIDRSYGYLYLAYCRERRVRPKDMLFKRGQVKK